MSFRSVVFALLLAAVLGCGRQEGPRHIVILPDVSGSIDRKALDQAFKAIDEMVGRLHRGDRIAIIPILGDAEAEASGRIIRFQVPTNRQAYDADLASFRRRLGTSLKEMQDNAIAHPGAKTDILGSIVLADQEFRAGQSESERLFVILSDFIQEDREVDFRKDARLATVASAKAFAIKTAKVNGFDFKKARTYLGLLRSGEYAVMSRTRREALQEFWIRYFQSSKTKPTFVADGPGLLKQTH